MCKYKIKCEIVKHSVGGGNAHHLVFHPPLNKPKKKKKKSSLGNTSARIVESKHITVNNRHKT